MDRVQCAASSRHLWAFFGGGGSSFVKSSDRLFCVFFSENDSRGSVPGLRLKDPHPLLLSIFSFLLLVSEFVSSPPRPSGSLATWLSSSLTQPKQGKKKKKEKTSSSVPNSSACRYVTREVLQLSERTAIGDSPRAIFCPSVSSFRCFFFTVTSGPLRRSGDVSRASPSLFPSALFVFLASIDRAAFNKTRVAPAETLREAGVPNYLLIIRHSKHETCNHAAAGYH